jgi:hypothetical protein
MAKPFTSPLLPPPSPQALEPIFDEDLQVELVFDEAFRPTLPCPPSSRPSPETIVAGLLAAIEGAALALPADSREVVRLRREARQIERLLGSLVGQNESLRTTIEIQALNARLFRGQS